MSEIVEMFYFFVENGSELIFKSNDKKFDKNE